MGERGTEEKGSLLARCITGGCVCVHVCVHVCEGRMGGGGGGEKKENNKGVIPFCTQGRIATTDINTLRISVELMKNLFSVQLASWT